MTIMDATIQMQLPSDLQRAITRMTSQAIEQALIEAKEKDGFPPYMTKTETAKYLHIAPKTLLDLESRYHDIPTIEIEGVTRYQRIALDEWMQRHQLKR
ncbi:hypothetical protein FD27_GL001209 [Limosilactobacillus frumenti DSM 13145]|uniref:Helix-turn-helix domain-containing protein n=2 Tax=Limosilactobacillus frumenti TaxID=104955 RepID=A0A0R1P4X8_9LACO|nr:hypothetical protein FD27_GL001209 [Limosilactobacillus frumenti DSM 13145]